MLAGEDPGQSGIRAEYRRALGQYHGAISSQPVRSAAALFFRAAAGYVNG